MVAASPKQIHFLWRTCGGACVMITYFFVGFFLGVGGSVCGGVTIVTVEIKTLFRKLNLITDREKVSFGVKNTSKNVTEGNVEMTTGRNAKSEVTTRPRIQTLLCPLTAHTLK